MEGLYGGRAWVTPSAWELSTDRDWQISNSENVRYIDIHTNVDPGRVLQRLHTQGLLEVEFIADSPTEEDGPKLRLLGITGAGKELDLTFEDVNAIG